MSFGHRVRSMGGGVRHERAARRNWTSAASTSSDINLLDSTVFAERVPHEWFAFLRQNAPVWWQEEEDGPGFWAVTSLAEATQVNRDYEHFSSATQGHLPVGAGRGRPGPAAAGHAQHGPPAPHPLPAPGQQGVHPPDGEPAPRADPRGHRRHHRRGHRAGHGRLRDRHRRRAPAGGHRRAARRAQRGPAPDVRLVEPDDRQRGPRVPDGGRGGPDGLDGALRLRLGAVRQRSGSTPTTT